MSLHNNLPAMGGINQQPEQSPQRGPMDLETVRRSYRAALYELTFNSKPIITNLTIMAQENQHAASIIVREIEQQLKNNAPGQKLPVLYLIDSICKNVGGAYINHFARNIVSTFMDAYTLTEPNVRRSFERLLQTWKNGMPQGNPVFPRHIIEPIERAIHYMRDQHPHAHSQPQHHSPHQQHMKHQPHPQHQPPRQHSNGPNGPNDRHPSHHGGSPRNPQIYVNPNFVQQPQRERESRDPRNRAPHASSVQEVPARAQPMYSKPLNQTTTVQMPSADALSALQSLLSSQSRSAPTGGGGTDAVSQLLGQTILPNMPSGQTTTVDQYLGNILGGNTAMVQNPTVAQTTPTAPTSLPHLTAAPSPVSSPMGGTQRLSHPPASAVPFSSQFSQLQTQQPQPVIDTSELLKGLTSLGYLNANSPMSSGALPNQPTQPPTQVGPVSLDSKDLQIPRQGAIELLYSELPLQCKQCGFRYPKTPEGQTKMDAHLDSHFRQNRRMKERLKRGLSRSWFVTEEEWISGEGGEVTSHQAPAFIHDQGSSQTTGGTMPTDGVPSGNVSPEEHMVVMPDNGRKPCPICGERFIDFWNDDEEEWMYKNAVLVNNTVYHATCHADALKSGILVSGDTDTVMNETDAEHEGAKRKMSIDEDDKLTKAPRI